MVYFFTLVEPRGVLISDIKQYPAWGEYHISKVKDGCVFDERGARVGLIETSLFQHAISLNDPFHVRVGYVSPGPSTVSFVDVYVKDGVSLTDDHCTELYLILKSDVGVYLKNDNASFSSLLNVAFERIVGSKDETFVTHSELNEIPVPGSDNVLTTKTPIRIIEKNELRYVVPHITRYFPTTNGIIIDNFNVECLKAFVSCANGKNVLVISSLRRINQWQLLFDQARVVNDDFLGRPKEGLVITDARTFVRYSQSFSIVWDQVLVDNPHLLARDFGYSLKQKFYAELRHVVSLAFWVRVSGNNGGREISVQKAAELALQYTPVHPEDVRRLWKDQVVNYIVQEKTNFVFENKFVEATPEELSRGYSRGNPTKGSLLVVPPTSSMQHILFSPLDKDDNTLLCFDSALNSVCAICFNNITNSLLQCGHSFCTECLLQVYVEVRPKCPMCRGRIKEHKVSCENWSTFWEKKFGSKIKVVAAWASSVPGNVLLVSNIRQVRTALHIVLKEVVLLEFADMHAALCKLNQTKEKTIVVGSTSEMVGCHFGDLCSIGWLDKGVVTDRTKRMGLHGALGATFDSSVVTVTQFSTEMDAVE